MAIPVACECTDSIQSSSPEQCLSEALSCICEPLQPTNMVANMMGRMGDVNRLQGTQIDHGMMEDD